MPIDKWIVPWTRVLGSVVSVVFPDIRRKIAKALESWDALDHSAFYILQPWKGIHYATSLIKTVSQVLCAIFHMYVCFRV